MAGIKKTTAKKAVAKKRKKRAKKKKDNVIKIFENFSLGQKAWFRTTAGDIGYGEIKQFHLKDSHGPVIQFQDEINGGRRHCLASETSFIEPKGGMKKLIRVAAKENAAKKKKKDDKK